ncbi:hypothetical protein Cni_G28573 [Canna indica]|uniref:DUF642 domain-containing protein n=1 Tax=Canna indica TaxID=4628 RepID=A0AAQ3QSG3_9LILI|nr:hypothetical protein Cni_G28573 [Canna indica]
MRLNGSSFSCFVQRSNSGEGGEGAVGETDDGADLRLNFKNPGMEDDPTCGPIIDSALLPTNLEEEMSALPDWLVESDHAVCYIDSNHLAVVELVLAPDPGVHLYLGVVIA